MKGRLCETLQVRAHGEKLIYSEWDTSQRTSNGYVQQTFSNYTRNISLMNPDSSCKNTVCVGQDLKRIGLLNFSVIKTNYSWILSDNLKLPRAEESLFILRIE
jgi:hypothetical protein